MCVHLVCYAEVTAYFAQFAAFLAILSAVTTLSLISNCCAFSIYKVWSSVWPCDLDLRVVVVQVVFRGSFCYHVFQRCSGVRCRRGIFGGIGGRRFIIIESDLSSCDFSQLSFTSEYSLTGNGSRSSRSRSSHASSNVSSRLWDFRYTLMTSPSRRFGLVQLVTSSVTLTKLINAGPG